MEQDIPLPTLPQKWLKSLVDLAASIETFFLAISCLIFWGLKIVMKTIFYGGPNQKEPWIIKLIRVIIQLLELVVEGYGHKHKKDDKDQPQPPEKDE